MMSPVERLRRASTGQGGVYRLCKQAADYIELLERQLHPQEHANALADLLRAQKRVEFLEGQLRIEQDERKSLEGRYAIIDARYKQVEERWHKLMERKDLQCGNRVDWEAPEKVR